MDISNNSYTELYYLIGNLDDNLKNQIPQDIIEQITEKMNKSFVPDIRNVSLDAKAMLSVIYSDYLCSSEDKKKWNEIDKLYFDSVEAQKNRNIVAKEEDTYKSTESSDANKTQMSLVVSKEDNFISRLVKKIKGLFSKIRRK